MYYIYIKDWNSSKIIGIDTNRLVVVLIIIILINDKKSVCYFKLL